MKVRELKEWLSNYNPKADVEYSIHRDRKRFLDSEVVQLHITWEGKPSGATLELTKEESKSS